MVDWEFMYAGLASLDNVRTDMVRYVKVLRDIFYDHGRNLRDIKDLDRAIRKEIKKAMDERIGQDFFELLRKKYLDHDLRIEKLEMMLATVTVYTKAGLARERPDAGLHMAPTAPAQRPTTQTLDTGTSTPTKKARNAITKQQRKERKARAKAREAAAAEAADPEIPEKKKGKGKGTGKRDSVQKQAKYPAEEHADLVRYSKVEGAGRRCRHWNSSTGCVHKSGKLCGYQHCCLCCGDSGHTLFKCRNYQKGGA